MFESFYNGRILIVDLAKGTTQEESLDEEMIKQYLGGAALNTALFEKNADSDPIIIGCGPLTASFAPGSCLGVMTARSPLSRQLVHVPLTWQTAVETKLSGFDFLVFLGKAPEPVHLWLHDELADIKPSSGINEKDAWEITDFLREEYGDESIQVLGVGPAGTKGSSASRVSENYWGSKDKFALGAVWGEKGLKAIASRGLGFFTQPDEVFPKAMELKDLLLAGKIKGKGGLLEMLDSLGANGKAKGILEKFSHRRNACFNCPYACNEFLMMEEEPASRKRSDKEEPGLQINNVSDLLALSPFGEDSLELLRKALKLGLDPTFCGLIIKKKGLDAPGAIKELDRLAREGGELGKEDLPNFSGVSPWPEEVKMESFLVQALGVFSNAVPPRPVIASYEDFSISEDPVERAQWWMKRQGIAYVLGLCPQLALISPELKGEDMVELLKAGNGWGELSVGKLEEIVKNMIVSSLKSKEGEEDINQSLKPEGFDESLVKLKEKFA
ncbi:MAG: hypothetical protein JSU92_09200 [Deltaproteobacteria bacterium]|nr:MAG: hypothetical protein JSU92_09200 [Deltaproteobacteria bacterium]